MGLAFTETKSNQRSILENLIELVTQLRSTSYIPSTSRACATDYEFVFQCSCHSPKFKTIEESSPFERREGCWKACFEVLNEYCRGWIGTFRVCTAGDASEFREFDAHLGRTPWAIIIHQKRGARLLYRHSVKWDYSIDSGFLCA